MRVCYFGTYHSTYPGNAMLIEGLRRNGVEILECHIPLAEHIQSKYHTYQSPISKIKFALQILIAHIKLIRKYLKIKGCDILIVGYMGQFDIFLAKIINLLTGKPVVFNPFFSLYDTIVLDRGLYTEKSLLAKIIRLLDYLSCRFSDCVFLDTKEHIKIWIERLGCPEEKIRHLPFGADDKIFYPRLHNRKEDVFFKVLFYGTFTPAQGVPYIIRAANILENKDVIFKIIGYGQVSDEVNTLAMELKVRNVEFIRWVKFNELQEHIEWADICLGMFGISPKTERCFANKVVQALGMRKPVITGDTSASREFLTDKKNVLFCQTGNPQSLADAILLLKNDRTLMERIANNGYQLFNEIFSPAQIGRRAKEYLEELRK